ncbi:metallophosphoesterase [Variovorax sp. Sphag1AA]|uniref:metallophosphoesterase n=1 Tax=Variovorax sp. Sphag1AA TaxID=2587027 RepID=UPI0017EF00DD|nr:metallophosphoesterase [Variovorax sp. Sphag1AA]MBB3178681.1 hypothetical protein [Variovorax sp. Sphag1AA]
MDSSEHERMDLAALEARVGRAHLRQRLSIEAELEARVIRRRTRSFGLGNLYSLNALVRIGLLLTGMHGRGLRNVLNIQLRNNEVRLTRLPPAFEGFRLLHLSDLHIDMSEAHLEHLVETVRGVAHDICVLTGDFRFRNFGPYGPTLDALALLRPHLGESAYAVLGNHDTVRLVPGMEAMGISVLMNESVRIERDGDSLMLAGIDDAHYFRTHNFHKAAADLAPDDCAILLSHTPEPYRLAAHADFSLMLSGHTHGGQICLPGGIPIITGSQAPRATVRGAWQHRGMVGYTSVGCGSSMVDVRFNCLPEVTLHRLHRG